MNFFWSGIFKMVAEILGKIIVNVTPSLVASLKEFLALQYLKSLETPNAWDDFFFGMLLDILSIPRPPPQ